MRHFLALGEVGLLSLSLTGCLMAPHDNDHRRDDSGRNWSDQDNRHRDYRGKDERNPSGWDRDAKRDWDRNDHDRSKPDWPAKRDRDWNDRD